LVRILINVVNDLDSILRGARELKGVDILTLTVKNFWVGLNKYQELGNVKFKNPTSIKSISFLFGERIEFFINFKFSWL